MDIATASCDLPHMAADAGDSSASRWIISKQNFWQVDPFQLLHGTRSFVALRIVIPEDGRDLMLRNMCGLSAGYRPLCQQR
jgi:hypothetical protein